MQSPLVVHLKVKCKGTSGRTLQHLPIYGTQPASFSRYSNAYPHIGVNPSSIPNWAPVGPNLAQPNRGSTGAQPGPNWGPYGMLLWKRIFHQKLFWRWLLSQHSCWVCVRSVLGLGGLCWVRVIFTYQHVGIGNAELSRWRSGPTRGPNAKRFAFWWNIGFSVFLFVLLSTTQGHVSHAVHGQSWGEGGALGTKHTSMEGCVTSKDFF